MSDKNPTTTNTPDPSPEAISFTLWLDDQRRRAEQYVDDTDDTPEPMPHDLLPRYVSELVEDALWETEARLERILASLPDADDLAVRDDATIALAAAHRVRRAWFRRDEIVSREGGAQ